MFQEHLHPTLVDWPYQNPSEQPQPPQVHKMGLIREFCSRKGEAVLLTSLLHSGSPHNWADTAWIKFFCWDVLNTFKLISKTISSKKLTHFYLAFPFSYQLHILLEDPCLKWGAKAHITINWGQIPWHAPVYFCHVIQGLIYPAFQDAWNLHVESRHINMCRMLA